MSDFESLKLAFVKALPSSVVNLLSEVTRCKAQGEERYRRLASTHAVVTMALGHGVFTHDDLLKLAVAVGAEPKHKADYQLADAIFDRMLDAKLQSNLGDLYPAFANFMDAITTQAEPILLLKPYAEGAVMDRVICYFNPHAAFETDWLSVDLRVHPDPDIRSSRVMSIRLDDYERGSLEFSECSDFKRRDDWIPLFAHSHIELPSIEIEGHFEEEFPIEFPREEFVEPYEMLANCSNLMTRPSFLHRQNQQVPWEVYAQLGGRQYPWVGDTEEDQAGRRLVVRTHANSEPWVEVSKEMDGNWLVVPHIT